MRRSSPGAVIGPTIASLGGHGLLIGMLRSPGPSPPTTPSTRSYLPILIPGVLGGLAIDLVHELAFQRPHTDPRREPA